MMKNTNQNGTAIEQVTTVDKEGFVVKISWNFMGQ